MTSEIILIAAGLFAGGLNAVAGGGTFISFPALIWLGIPPVSANATATLTALPGYFTSAWAFRGEIAKESKANLFKILGFTFIEAYDREFDEFSRLADLESLDVRETC